MDSLLQELANIEAAAQLQSDYRKTLALLRALKAGSVSLDNVTMTSDGWTVAAIAPPPEPDKTEDETEGETDGQHAG